MVNTSHNTDRDRHLRARCLKWIAHEKLLNEPGTPADGAAQRAYDRFAAKQWKAFVKIAATPALTFPGLRAKAQVMVAADVFPDWPDSTGDERFARALLRDIEHLTHPDRAHG